MPKPTILVVDDEETCRDLYREVLETHGYDVILASCKQEAVETIQRREIDAIICDIQLPGNGVTVYEYLVEHFPELRGRFIFMTGNVEKKELVEQTHKSTPCLLKPFPMRLLLEAMSAALGGGLTA